MEHFVIPCPILAERLFELPSSGPHRFRRRNSLSTHGVEALAIEESSGISSALHTVLVVRFGGHTTALCAVLEPLPMQTHSGWCVVCSQ